MSNNYEQSYLGQLRKMIGKTKVFVITARAIVQNPEGQILFVKRSDNGKWVMPAGSMELEESILDTCKREVFEESGLIVESATLISVYTDPRYSFVTAYDDPYQPISFVFRIDSWSGEILKQTDETVDAQFFSLSDLPPGLSNVYQETLEDLKAFDGEVIIK